MIAVLRSLNEGMKQAVHMFIAVLARLYDLAYEWAGLIFLMLLLWLVTAVVLVNWK